jgi:hypothetical protein
VNKKLGIQQERELWTTASVEIRKAISALSKIANSKNNAWCTEETKYYMGGLNEMLIGDGDSGINGIISALTEKLLNSIEEEGKAFLPEMAAGLPVFECTSQPDSEVFQFTANFSDIQSSLKFWITRSQEDTLTLQRKDTGKIFVFFAMKHDSDKKIESWKCEPRFDLQLTVVNDWANPY